MTSTASGRYAHRFGASPPLSLGVEEELLLVDERRMLIAAAGVEDYTYIWWDVRPHPRLGTVEVRAVDVQTDVVTSSAIAALIQAIAAKELDRPTRPGLYREALEESYFQAASEHPVRRGHPGAGQGGRTASARIGPPLRPRAGRRRGTR